VGSGPDRVEPKQITFKEKASEAHVAVDGELLGLDRAVLHDVQRVKRRAHGKDAVPPAEGGGPPQGGAKPPLLLLVEVARQAQTARLAPTTDAAERDQLPTVAQCCVTTHSDAPLLMT
jgi:hypothetical protein